jgi:hypothetical protein
MNCININDSKYKELLEQTKLNPLILKARISIFQDKNGLESFPKLEDVIQSNEVNQSLKSVDILSSDKAKQIFEKGKKSNWDLNKILTELQIPKDQKQLILDLDKTNREEIITDLLAKYSYTIEINTAKEQIKTGTKKVQGSPIKYYSKSENRYYRDTEELGWISSDENNKNQEVDVQTPEDLEPIEFDTYNIDTFSELETKHYSNLTVPGGTNYTENEISTPLITPSIKGHAQFSTDKGIGWFRSDEQQSNNDLEEQREEEEYQIANNPNYVKGSIQFEKGEGSKTRRILEVQSDLFQKGRDKDYLPKYPFKSNDNKFLQLLNKDNNWVTFFVKSIIQDSVKKGYEKILFPSGNTASKVEGHTTLEEFKKQKEDRLKELEDKVNKGRYVLTDNTGFPMGIAPIDSDINVLKSNNPTLKIEKESLTQKELDDTNNEINQLKQELERVEGPEGFGALKPIYNFYENTVKNVLNKQYGKENVKQVTDEYGNTWNELTLEESRDTSTILFNKKDLNDFVGDNSKPFFPESTTNQPQVNNRFQINKELLFNDKNINNSFKAKDVLQNIINSNLEFSDAGNNLVFKAMNVLNRSNSRVKVISQEQFDKMTENSEGNGTAVMAYESELNVIYTTENSLSIFTKEQILESFLHEVAHNLSIKAIINPVTFEEIQFNELIKKAFEQYKYLGKNLKGSKSYGFTNEKEFVAELYSNEEFQNEIKSLDKNFWQQFKDAIRRLFGLTKSLQNNELINSILLIENVEKFIETSQQSLDGLARNDYSNSFNNIMFKKIEQPKEIELDTLDKQLNYTIEKALDKIDAIIRRTKKSKNSKNKQDNEAFVKSFTELFKEIETLENTNKWQAVNAYVTSFSKTVFHLNQMLKTKLYNKDTETFNKDISSEEMLDLSYRYEEYLTAYDLLEDIKKLLQTSETDEFVTKQNQIEINKIKDILANLTKDHNSLTGIILNIKKAHAVKMMSEADLNTEVVAKWRNKLFQEHTDLKITNETKEAYFGRMIEGKYKDEYNKALVANARKIVNDPSFDIESVTRSVVDILNTNSPLLNMMSNVIGKMRDSIISAARTKNFEIDKVYKKYSAEKGQNKQSQMYKNLVELSKSDDRYYLHGEYSTTYLDSFNSLQPVFKARKELVALKLAEGLTNSQIKKLPEYKLLNKQIANWFKANTIKVDGITYPNPKYKNKELTGIEKETLDYFIYETEKNDDSYNGTASLITLIPGATFYKLPSVTKSDLERTLEGDIKGQFVDKWKDLNEVRVDDVSYGEAINNKNEELRTVRVHYRGKIESKNQSLDLFTVYRKEAFNAINYAEKKENEYKLKLFVDIASSKQYKKRSKSGGWAQNVFATKQPGVIVEGEFSEELKRIKGLLESTAYDILSYNGQKVLGTNIEANKLSSLINGTAASIAMTMNLGSGVVNVMNGVTQMFIESVGGRNFKKADLLKAEANYSKNLMNILADLNEPVKKSFHNQMLEMFDVFGGFDVSTQEFLRNSYAKKLISKQQMNMLNEMGEHMMNSVLTEVMLRGIKVMNEQRQFIDKSGNVVEESKAASLFDMLSLNKDGVLEMDSKVVYTLKNLDSKYHESGKYHINYVIKKKAHDIFGVYDPLMKAEIAKHWWGKTVLMFKNFFLSGLKYRYQGISKSLKKKEDLTDDDIVFNNAEQEFTEGTYVTFIRFVRNVVFPALKGLQLAHMSDGYNKLTDYEKANLRKTTLEVGLTMVLLPMLGYLLASLGGDDDDKPYFALYVFRRLESELSQYRNPIELNRMIQNPVAANRFIQNSLNALGEIITPLNFNPGNNEYLFDYLSEDSKGKNKVVKSIKKITPFYAQFQKPYREMHNLINK